MIPTFLCLRLHRDAIRLRFLTRSVTMLWCARCEAFR